MICFERKVVFVHIPKTAGTIIEQCFAGVNDFSNIHIPKSFIDKNMQTHGRHYSAPQIIEHLETLNLNPDDFTFFTVIRNPWTRNFSATMYDCKKKKVPFKFDLDTLKGQGEWGKGYDKYVPQWFKRMDYILRFEDIGQQFRSMCVDQGWDDIKDVLIDNMTNVSGSILQNYKDFYTPQMVDFVANNNVSEVDVFGYMFN